MTPCERWIVGVLGLVVALCGVVVAVGYPHKLSGELAVMAVCGVALAVWAVRGPR